MEHTRELILQAEEQIQQFADQLARAKQVVDGVETIEKLLHDAAQQVSVACKTLEQAQQHASDVLRDASLLAQRSIRELEHATQQVVQTNQQMLHTLQQQIGNQAEQQRRQLDTIAQELATQTQRIAQTSQEAISSAIALMARLKDETLQSLQGIRAQLDSMEQTTARQAKILYLIIALLIVVLILGVGGLVVR